MVNESSTEKQATGRGAGLLLPGGPCGPVSPFSHEAKIITANKSKKIFFMDDLLRRGKSNNKIFHRKGAKVQRNISVCSCFASPRLSGKKKNRPFEQLFIVLNT